MTQFSGPRFPFQFSPMSSIRISAFSLWLSDNVVIESFLFYLDNLFCRFNYFQRINFETNFWKSFIEDPILDFSEWALHFPLAISVSLFCLTVFRSLGLSASHLSVVISLSSISHCLSVSLTITFQLHAPSPPLCPSQSGCDSQLWYSAQGPEPYTILIRWLRGPAGRVLLQWHRLLRRGRLQCLFDWGKSTISLRSFVYWLFHLFYNLLKLYKTRISRKWRETLIIRKSTQ